MDPEQFDQDLLALRVPSVTPGPHMQALSERLSPRWGVLSRERMSHRRRTALVAGIAVASLLAAAAGTYTYQRYVFFTGSAWSTESEPPYELTFSNVDPAHRDEAIALWKSGQVSVLEATSDTPDLCSGYVIRFDFQDGTSYTAKINDHPNPAAREEMRRLRDAGAGELVSLRRSPYGHVFYLIRYLLPDGEAFKRFEDLPPMSKADRLATLDYIGEQLKCGAGTIVGTMLGRAMVELTLPDGRPYTTLQEYPYPRPGLTAARQDEISEMIALGKGELVDQFFSGTGSVYLVKYTLSDGSIFRIGTERPVMTDAEWDAARAEAAALYAAGQYTRESVTAVDGQPVEVLVMTLSTGYIAKIRDIPETRAIWGIE